MQAMRSGSCASTACARSRSILCRSTATSRARRSPTRGSRARSRSSRRRPSRCPRRRFRRTGSGAATCSCTSTPRRGPPECARVLRPGGAMVAYVTLATDLLEPRERAELVDAMALQTSTPSRSRRRQRSRASLRSVDRLDSEWRERMIEDKTWDATRASFSSRAWAAAASRALQAPRAAHGGLALGDLSAAREALPTVYVGTAAPSPRTPRADRQHAARRAASSRAERRAPVREARGAEPDRLDQGPRREGDARARSGARARPRPCSSRRAATRESRSPLVAKLKGYPLTCVMPRTPPRTRRRLLQMYGASIVDRRRRRTRTAPFGSRSRSRRMTRACSCRSSTRTREPARTTEGHRSGDRRCLDRVDVLVAGPAPAARSWAQALAPRELPRHRRCCGGAASRRPRDGPAFARRRLASR